jgi:predicted nucleotidyltransferase
VARGEARPDSDVDILVDLELGRSLFDHAQLQIDLAMRSSTSTGRCATRTT